MADGDDAAAAGLSTVPSSALVKNGHAEINKSRDYVARHGTGTLLPHALSHITGLVAALAGKATTSAAAIADGKAEQARRGEMDIAIWVRNITWSRQAVWMGDPATALQLGYSPSTRATKKILRDVPWTEEQLRAIPIIHHHYLAELKRQRSAWGKKRGYKAPTEVATLADDLHELGLWEFVVYERDENAKAVLDEHGEAIPQTVRYELLGLAALRLAQLNATRLDELEQRLNHLEGKNS